MGCVRWTTTCCTVAAPGDGYGSHARAALDNPLPARHAGEPRQRCSSRGEELSHAAPLRHRPSRHVRGGSSSGASSKLAAPRHCSFRCGGGVVCSLVPGEAHGNSAACDAVTRPLLRPLSDPPVSPQTMWRGARTRVCHPQHKALARVRAALAAATGAGGPTIADNFDGSLRLLLAARHLTPVRHAWIRGGGVVAGPCWSMLAGETRHSASVSPRLQITTPLATLARCVSASGACADDFALRGAGHLLALIRGLGRATSPGDCGALHSALLCLEALAQHK